MNPYRGCAHGCSYCYARPYHEYLGFSAGLDFETKVLVKHRAPELLREWLARPSWRPETIAFSGVTDCYQPAEREFELTRGCLEVAVECRQPIGIITKNALVTRDVDLLHLDAHRLELRGDVSDDADSWSRRLISHWPAMVGRAGDPGDIARRNTDDVL